MLRQRILTALLLLPLVFTVIWWVPPFGFLLFWVAVVCVAAWEWLGLLLLQTVWLKLLFYALLIAMLWMAQSLNPMVVLSCSLFACMWLWLAVIVYKLRGHSLWLEQPAVNLLLGVSTLVGFVVACGVLRHFSSDPFWLLYSFFIAWIGDSAAYFGGRYFGGAKLCCVVSPKKTWSGFFCGFLGAVIFAVSISFVFPFSLRERVILWSLTSVVFVASVLGDLAISLLKRLANIKDSSALLPGHGGVLDRLDSVLATTILMAFGLLNFGV